MTQAKIHVEIVTPVHNRRETTLQCLRSLSKIDETGLEVGVIVVDDGSNDGTSDAIRKEFPEVDLIKGSGDLWFTEGTNVGIRHALTKNPKFILAMNDDQVFDPNFLVSLVQTAEKYPRSVVGSMLLLWDVPHKLFQVSPVWNTWMGGWRHWRHQTVWTVPNKPWEVDIVVGNCVLIPTSAILECGLMDSKRYPNFGDAEYTPRLKRKGFRLLIDPRSRVFCQPNDVPARIGSIKLKEIPRALIFDMLHIHNFRRRFYTSIGGAPSKLKGVAAFGVFLARLALRINPESSWSEKRDEKPISEIFADRIVGEH
jgi:GT2 family glycosyltransferase